MSLSTALIPYTAPKPAAQFIAEQVVNEKLIMRWEKHIAKTRFFYECEGSPLGGHPIRGRITAAEATAKVVVQFFSGILARPVAELVTRYVGYDYGDGYDFYFFRILPDGTAEFRVVEAIDRDEQLNVVFGSNNRFALRHSVAFESERVLRDAAEVLKWAALQRR
jgi:hypothetical protein